MICWLKKNVYFVQFDHPMSVINPYIFIIDVYNNEVGCPSRPLFNTDYQLFAAIEFVGGGWMDIGL